MRNALAHAGKSGAGRLGLHRHRLCQDTPEAASQQWRSVADQMRPKLPKLATLMDDAEPDVLAYMTFPGASRQVAQHQPHRAPQWRDQAQDRGRWHLPNEAITRLIGAILMEQSDEWAVQRALHVT
jgi:transposase-like protein